MNSPASVHSAWREWRATGAQQQRVAYWRDTICQAVLDVDMVSRQFDSRPVFRGSIQSLDRLGARLVSFASSGHGVVRTARQADRADNSHLMVSLQLAGVSRISQRNSEIVLQPGDIGIIDTAYPFELLFPEDVERRMILLPRHLLARSAARLSALARPVHICQSFSLSPVLASFLKTATQSDRELASGHLLLLLDGLADYLYESLQESPHGRTVPASRHHYQEAQAYIAAHIRNPELSILNIALALGVSIRTLHRLFQRFSDTSCEKYIFNQRLELAYRELENAQHATVADVAFSVGFNDQAHFTRRFRERFGTVPSVLL